jgi:hypothetical protein
MHVLLPVVPRIFSKGISLVAALKSIEIVKILKARYRNEVVGFFDFETKGTDIRCRQTLQLLVHPRGAQPSRTDSIA